MVGIGGSLANGVSPVWLTALAAVKALRCGPMELGELQRLMAATYGERDRARGVPATVAWLTEELGELAQAVRKGSAEDQLHELGDVLAWLASLAEQLGLSLDDAVARYADGCPMLRRDPLPLLSGGQRRAPDGGSRRSGWR